jgi:hypothetical protein
MCLHRSVEINPISANPYFNLNSSAKMPKHGPKPEPLSAGRSEIKIKDLPGIQVGDWKSWAQAGSKKQASSENNGSQEMETLPDRQESNLQGVGFSFQDTVMSNKTLEEVEQQVANKPEPGESGTESEGEYI